MKTYDKAAWHIDAGVKKGVVTKHFTLLFSWLESVNLLSDEGLELFEMGLFSDASLNERLLNDKGNAFISAVYDKLLEEIPYGTEGIVDFLNMKYENNG